MYSNPAAGALGGALAGAQLASMPGMAAAGLTGPMGLIGGGLLAAIAGR
jgi:hypothetical protein